MLDYAIADALHHPREHVAAYVWMGVGKNRLLGAESHQLAQNLLDITSFGRTGVELSVRESTGTTLTEAIVGICIDNALADYGGNVDLSAVNVLSTLENNRFQPFLEQFEGCESASGTSANHDNLRSAVGILVVEDIFARRLVTLQESSQPVAEDRTAACVE